MADPVLVDCGKKVIAKFREYCTETDDNGENSMTKAKLQEMVQSEFGVLIKDPKHAEAVKQLMKMVDNVKESKITMPVLCAFYGNLLIVMSKGPQDSSPVDTVLPSCAKKIISKFNEFCTGTDDQGQNSMSKAKLQELVHAQFEDMIKTPRNPDAAKAILKQLDEIEGPKITLEDTCPLYIKILIYMTNSMKQ